MIPVAGGTPEKHNTGDVTRNNNDHGISFDKKWLAISSSLEGSTGGGSAVYVVPLTGGNPKLVTQKTPSYWHGWAPNNKEVMVVEIGMPWDDASNCKAFISDLINKTKSVTNNKGLGVLYWEPQCYGNWKGYTLGAFDNNGRPTVAMEAFAN